MIFVTDTHSLIWYLGGSPLLGANARSAFERVLGGDGLVIVPAICIAELVMLAEKRRVAIDVDEIMQTLRETSGFVLSALSSEIAVKIRGLSQLNDIHDRLIVAETQARNATLITRDELITSSKIVPTIW
jgi:PIN domain nuclease of toxin-antitoxin system